MRISYYGQIEDCKHNTRVAETTFSKRKENTVRRIMEQRIGVLKSMDNIIRHINDETYMNTWLMLGVPDCASDNDYEFIASHDNEYNDITKLFFEICSMAYKDNNYSTWC